MGGKGVEGIRVGGLEDAEEGMCIRVKEDGVVVYAGRPEEGRQFGPYLVVSASVFGGLAVM
jgi:hypothetical protein